MTQPHTAPLQSIRGMNDILPQEIAHWQHVEKILNEVVTSYGYQEIRFPIVESTNLFTRTIGEATDIVAKEMYTFIDRNDESLTLRPEGTAGCVRAGIQHGLLYNQIQRFWYSGPMFRHERPQKGRLREFHQFGVEVFGLNDPDIDAELLLMTARFWRLLGIQDKVTLKINSLGTSDARSIYRQKLVEYFSSHQNLLDEDSKRRLTLNPLRILDSKNPALQNLIHGAPKLLEYLDSDARAHFETLCYLLDANGVQYSVEPHLVRGLDYYSKTVFEWETSELGAQGAICAGGRYDALVEQLGGKSTPAIGFAIGLERLVSLVAAFSDENFKNKYSYVIILGDNARANGLLQIEKLRDVLPKQRFVFDCKGGNLSSQLKRADKSGAHWAIIIGDEEVKSQTFLLKWLRNETGRQEKLTFAQLVELFTKETF